MRDDPARRTKSPKPPGFSAGEEPLPGSFPALMPHRVSLVDQTAELLRAELERRVWVRQLPSERALRSQFQVSRKTLRQALKVLEQAGWIRKRQGQRSQILRHGKHPHVGQQEKVVWLHGVEPHRVSTAVIVNVMSLHIHLAEAGWKFEFEAHASVAPAEIPVVMRRYERRHRPTCWVLGGAAAAMQRWFQQQGLATVILGARAEGVSLPCLDLDHRATCFHAAGQLLARGHRRLALLVPASEAVDDFVSEQGFVEGLRAAQGRGASYVVVRHPQTVEAVERSLRRLMQSAAPPTAILVADAADALAAFSCLTNRLGRRVLQDVSLLCRDEDLNFAQLTPPLSHYSFGLTAVPRKLFRMVSGYHNLPPGHCATLSPRLIAGGSVAAR